MNKRQVYHRMTPIEKILLRMDTVFLLEADEACKDNDRKYFFVCPICGNGQAKAMKDGKKEHLSAKCDNCHIHLTV